MNNNEGKNLWMQGLEGLICDDLAETLESLAIFKDNRQIGHGKCDRGPSKRACLPCSIGPDASGDVLVAAIAIRRLQTNLPQTQALGVANPWDKLQPLVCYYTASRNPPWITTLEWSIIPLDGRLNTSEKAHGGKACASKRCHFC